MTFNKGIPILLRAVKAACGSIVSEDTGITSLALILKGQDGLYDSKGFVNGALEDAHALEMDCPNPTIVYSGSVMTFEDIAGLMQVRNRRCVAWSTATFYQNSLSANIQVLLWLIVSYVARLQASDVYVAPYLGEGFNLPVLESVACGTPVIVTSGGPTDAFTAPAFATRIPSR